MDRSRNLIFLVVHLQVFLKVFPLLGTTTLGVPYFATEHTNKMRFLDYFSRVHRLLPMAFLLFTLQSALQVLYLLGTVFNSNVILWSIYSALLHLASLGAALSVPKYLSAAAYEVHRLFSVQISPELLYSLVSWPLQGFPKIIVSSLNSQWVSLLQSLPIPWQWQQLEAVQCN